MTINRIQVIIDLIKSEEGRKSVLKEYDDKKFFKLLGSLSDEEKPLVCDLVLQCIKLGDSELLRYLAVPVLEKKRFIDWKKRSDFVVAMFDKILEGCSRDETVRYSDFVTKLIEMLNSQQLTKEHSKQMYRLIMLSFGGKVVPERFNVHLLALHVVKVFPWTDEKEKLSEVIKTLQKTVELYGDSPEDTTLSTNVYLFFMYAFYLDKSNGRNQNLVLQEVTKLFEHCSKQDWQCSEVPNKNNLYYKVLLTILEYFVSSMGTTQADLLRPMYKTILELRNCGEEELEKQVNKVLGDVANETGLVGDETSELLESYLDGKMDGIGYKLKDMYLNQPAPFHPLMSRFADMFLDSNDSTVSNLIMFFTEVARKEPEVLPDRVPGHMTKFLTHQWYFGVAMMFFDAWATVRPGEVFKYENDIIRATQRNENAAGITSNLLPKIAVDDQKRERYIKYLADKCRADPAGIMVASFVNSMRVMGSGEPALLLAPHKELLEDLMERNPTAKDICQIAINVIEGKSLEHLAEDVIGAKKNMDELQDKMDSVENNVNSIKEDVQETRKDVMVLQNDMNENTETLNRLGVSVEETKAKVEEIDHKTLSHTPGWSREVSKLLNQSGDKDWRLLARRLGYTNDDIVNWATQPDPCMSMLDDWFATHKTRDATHGVMKVLDDMDRMDAYSLVEEAIKDAEYMVGNDDDDDDEASRGPTPVVFLSYQWAHQQEVKLLKRHLTLSGYPCWMDVGQMGGGDKLYSKIDEGMRTARVVLCCVSERYAESPNCNREVNLAVNLGKPMIPLLMEKMPWPPKGGMGPIFGEFLFVRFYRREAEGSEDNGLFWPPSMFTQLVMQIRYSVAPNQDLIPDDSPYKNWWDPPEEVIIIKKKGVAPKVKEASQVNVKQESNESDESPEVFISYQWDKQPEIRDLYKRLTTAGLDCWLDVNMMRGGDSLYDKIDRGIRGARVVLSCVTRKYAISGNCRREVALSDAIKKPIIPLLLEGGAWPPEGPMGMILTQLVYIDFSQSEKRSQPWDDGDKFNELMGKIRQHISYRKEPSDAVVSSTKIQPSNKEMSAKTSRPADAGKAQATASVTSAKTATNSTKTHTTFAAAPVTSAKTPATSVSNPKQPANKRSTSLSTNRKLPSSSSSSSISSSSTSRTVNRVMNLFKPKTSKK